TVASTVLVLAFAPRLRKGNVYESPLQLVAVGHTHAHTHTFSSPSDPSLRRTCLVSFTSTCHRFGAIKSARKRRICIRDVWKHPVSQLGCDSIDALNGFRCN